RVQRRELAGVKPENERLRFGIAAASTNDSTGAMLPAGYIRKSQARMAGYATPEDTIQSFLWAMHRQDFTNLLQAFTPEASRRLVEGKVEEFVERADEFPGMSIAERQQLPDGTLKVKLLMAPNAAAIEVRFQQIAGQWKMEIPD